MSVVHPYRCIFGDTDMMGVVYYGNYMRFFEASRAAWWRSFGKTYADMQRIGIAWPVVEAGCRYRRPAFYEDLLDIEVTCDEMRGAQVRFVYAVRRGSHMIAEGFTRHASVGADGKPKLIPAEYREIIKVAPLTGTGPIAL